MSEESIHWPYKLPQELLYVVLFAGEQHEAVPPLVPMQEVATTNTFYGLDPAVTAVFPALRYVLNLPRNAYDLEERSFFLVKELKKLDLPHNILLAPWPDSWGIAATSSRNVALVIYQESLPREDIEKAFPESLLGCVSQATLSPVSCRSHWNALEQIYGVRRHLLHPHTPHLGSGTERIVLAHTARLTSIPQLNSEEDHQDATIQAHHLAETMALLEADGVERNEVPLYIQAARRRAVAELSIPLVLVAPGLPRTLRKTLVAMGGDEELPEEGTADEVSAMDILGAHRAIARGGVHILLPKIPNQLYHELAAFEQQYYKRQRNIPKIRSQLQRLGNLTGQFLQQHIPRPLLYKSKDILIMSQFPLGLAILEGTSVPLAMLRPVYYRPIVPLTRMLQMELPDTGTHYWELRNPRLLIVECLNPKDKIYPISRNAWRFVQEEMNQAYEVAVEPASSIADLTQLLEKHTPDILILSAHGTVGPAANQHSILIGDDLYTGIEIPRLPPLVLLSACATSPRGVGPVNVADLMLRHRATAVLCCLVPVDVWHNARLFVRFLINIHETRTGEKDLRTVADVWNFTSSSNAVLDITHSLERMPKASELSLQEYEHTFMTSRSRGRLRITHIYDDTREVLAEIAAEYNQAPRFNSLINNGFLPESQFYMLLGRPEKIVLRAEEHRKFAEAMARSAR